MLGQRIRPALSAKLTCVFRNGRVHDFHDWITSRLNLVPCFFRLSLRDRPSRRTSSSFLKHRINGGIVATLLAGTQMFRNRSIPELKLKEFISFEKSISFKAY